MTTAKEIKAAGSKLLLWRKIYNLLCRGCKRKVFLAGTGVKQIGTEGVVDKMQDVIDNKLCKACNNRIELIIKNSGGKDGI